MNIYRLARVVGLVLLAWAAATPPAPAETENADKLMIVDCLLPGQIRQLGGSMTYMTARRPIKTSAGDCEIRGGEYTAFDRASYASALKVWLPMAQEGKPDAQTNVGEIFEKGLGVPPDYGAAAVWYKKAADQGYSRAAIDLGSLYERGLGVPKDPVQALNWYRHAAGLGDVDFKIATDQPPAPTPAPANSAASNAASGKQAAEVQQLQAEVARLRQQLSDKEDELRRTQQELQQQRDNIKQQSGEADTQRAELAALRRDLDTKRQQEGDKAKGVAELERVIADGETHLKAQDQEVAQLRANLARAESESKAQQADLARIRHEADATPPALAIVEPDLVATRGPPTLQVPKGENKLVLVGRVDSGVGLVSLTVNGGEQKLDGAMFRYNLALGQSEQQVHIAAVDRNGRKATLDFVVPALPRAAPPVAATNPNAIGIPTPAGANFGSYHALVIGNNDYHYLPKLQTAVGDAQEVARILKETYGYDVTVLLNGTRYQILSAMNKLREKLTDKDNVLIYYAGHGVLDQVNNRGNWLPVDAESDNTANWISNVAVTDILNAMNVRQLLVVSDSCYSGTLTRSAVAQIGGGVTTDERLKVLELMAQQRSRMALTAGGIEPVLDSAGGKHSAFAQRFIDVLDANVGVVSGQQLFQALQARVAAAAERLDAHQVPEYAPIKFAGHESGDFLFVRVN